MEESSVEDQILRIYADGNWREILRRFDRNRFLPWIWPKEENLLFIEKHVRMQNSNTVVSIGCGSGLFEGLLKMATGVNVIGMEISGIWWKTKYSPGCFIPMILVDDSTIGEFNFDLENFVLLFCYFNNLKAFLNYLKNFNGKCFIVIGPDKGKSVYSIPEPFCLPEPVAEDWNLFDHQEIQSSKDFIAVYIRK